MVQWHRFYVQLVIAGCFTKRRQTVVLDNTQHVLCVFLVARECTQFASDFSRCRIRYAGHDRSQRSTHGAALFAVIAKAHVHQQTADVRIAKTKRAEVVRPLRDFFGWELRHHHRDFQGHSPQTCGVHVVFDLELAVLVECQQVHRRKVTGRVIKEHVFRTRV